MSYLEILLDRFALWRPYRQGWHQFFKKHLVQAVATGLTVIAICIGVMAPATSVPLAVWLVVMWVGGKSLYWVRQSNKLFPCWRRYLFEPEYVGAHGLVAFAGTAVLLWVIFPREQGANAFYSDFLWTFLLLPLIYLSRYGKSEHFRVLLFISLLYILALPTLVLSSDLVTVSSSVMGAVLLGMVAIGAHGTIRTLNEKDVRVQRLNKIVNQISNREQIKTRYDWIARIICEELRYPVIHLMAWDPSQELLVVKGAAGKPAMYWKKVRLARGQGITGRVFASRREICCNDTCGAEGRKFEYISREGYEDIRAELAVPLIYGQECLGVLDFQSTRRGEFDEDDVVEAHLLAKAVTIAMKWNETAHTQLLLWKTLNRARRCKNVDALMNELLDNIRDHLGASVVTLYPLIPETGLPRIAHPYRRGKLLVDESVKGGIDSFLMGKPLQELTRRWEYYFSPDAPNDPRLRGAVFREGDFISRERIRSVIFLPLGERDYKLGILFLNYREDHELSFAVQAQIRAFAAVFTLALRRLHEKARAEQSVKIGVHRNMAKYFYPIKTQLTSVWGVSAELGVPILDQKLQNLESSINQLRNRALRDTTGVFDTLPTGLQDAIQNASGSLKTSQGIEAIVRVDPKVDVLSKWLHAVLYNIAVEGLSNAITHGQARRVRVDIHVSTREGIVECLIIDDGCGFDPGQVPHGTDGIFALAKWVREELNGDSRFIRRDEGGMRIEFSIPVLAERSADESQSQE